MSDNAKNDHLLDIALITPTLDGGVGLVTSRLAQSLTTQGKQVGIWTLAGGSYASEAASAVTVRHLGVSRASQSLGALTQLIETHKPQTMLSASYHMNCIAVLARRNAQSSTRLVLVEHTSLEIGLSTLSWLKHLIARIAIRYLYPRADAYVAVSQDAATQMATYAGLSPDIVRVIYNPVITPELAAKATEPCEHPFFETGEPVLLTVSRLSPEKDFATMLDAFAQAQKQRPIRLLIIGEGPERAHIEQLITKYNLGDSVALLGHIANPYPYYTKSNLFVLSSRREGLPTVLIEALALEVPIVSTDARSGPREILHDGAYGTLVPVGNPTALAQAILAALETPRTPIPDEILRPYMAETATAAYLDVLFPTT